MAGAVDHAEQAALFGGAIDVEVAADHVAGVPEHRVALIEIGHQLALGQDGVLDKAGVIDRVLDFLVCGGHVAVGLLQFTCAFVDAALQLAGMAMNFQRHAAKRSAEFADLVVPFTRQRRVVVSGSDGLSALAQLPQRAEYATVDQPGAARDEQQQ